MLASQFVLDVYDFVGDLLERLCDFVHQLSVHRKVVAGRAPQIRLMPPETQRSADLVAPAAFNASDFCSSDPTPTLISSVPQRMKLSLKTEDKNNCSENRSPEQEQTRPQGIRETPHELNLRGFTRWFTLQRNPKT